MSFFQNIIEIILFNIAEIIFLAIFVFVIYFLKKATFKYSMTSFIDKGKAISNITTRYNMACTEKSAITRKGLTYEAYQIVRDNPRFFNTVARNAADKATSGQLEDIIEANKVIQKSIFKFW